MISTIFTVGHSTHSFEKFVALLKQHNVTAICDVRSSPYSKINPQFNRETLKNSLRGEGISYVFLGKELGARSTDPSCYENGKVKYERLASTDLFAAGLQRVREGSKTHTIALMCAEKDPLACHRTILVTRHLVSREISAQHILEDGSLETHDHAIRRLIRQLKLPEGDMFQEKDDYVEEAYRIQGERIAYEEGSGGKYSVPKSEAR
jgi:uncharacterized protein (DUF488 family)